MAIDGDTIVVGAFAEDGGAEDAGAAYVFVREGGTWSEQAYLKASNTGGSDHFGAAVSVSGDTVVVGSYGEDSSSTGVNGPQNELGGNSGAAYVFTRQGGVWTQQAFLKASNTGTGDQFGTAVATSGDTIVVGAPGENSNSTGVNGHQANEDAGDSGAAYVFTRTAGTWSQQA